jgi:hypothetical protein
MQNNNGHYSLSNPLFRIIGKESADFTREDLIKVIEKNQ